LIVTIARFVARPHAEIDFTSFGLCDDLFPSRAVESLYGQQGTRGCQRP
jgi:hypothetical protein